MNWNYKGNLKIKRLLSNQIGSSLLELVTIVAMVGILASVAVPNYSNWVLKRQVERDAKSLSLELMLARIVAIKNNNNVRVTFNVAGNQYTVHDDTNSDGNVNGAEIINTILLNPRIQFGFFGAGINDPDGAAVNTSVSLSGGGTILTFNPRGQASDTGSMYLIPVSEVVQSNLLLRAVSVIQTTGSVDYWEYNAGTNTWQ